jgi:protein tyrosine phosphatase
MSKKKRPQYQELWDMILEEEEKKKKIIIMNSDDKKHNHEIEELMWCLENPRNFK